MLPYINDMLHNILMYTTYMNKRDDSFGLPKHSPPGIKDVYVRK